MKKPTINYSPCHNKVILRLVKAGKQLLHIPDTVAKPLGNKFIVKAVGPAVTCCKQNDEIILHPAANVLGLDEALGFVLVDDSSILAIVTHTNFID